ncbi:hypothetical protein FRC08_016385 [Ceratobasidium sp. 394]|nr:hypothetical protein FRC08_016385 [Ceratobasidium sp. 394]
MSVYDARCEVQSDRISHPIKLRLSQGNACLALNGAGGWKNRAPSLAYYLLDGSKTVAKFESRHFLEPGLAEVAVHMALDESRHLIFVGDDNRVKSYSWAKPSGGNHKHEPLATHTLDSDFFRGPITVLPDGTLVRAGKGQVAVWDINSLETHGETGEEIIGEEDEDILEDTMRDDPEDIELSTGNAPTSRIKFADTLDLSVTRWEPLCQAPSTMLCHSEPYGCYTIDLEHEGKIAARYLGHGGKIADLSVSEGDPRAFLTACSDGYARLFDIRTPLPVLTFDACGQDEFCEAAVLAHPDGIPSKCTSSDPLRPLLTILLAVFTGTDKAEQIKMWDVRACTPVYELATGNNRVQSLAWDSKRNCLYAATECSYQDRMGYRHDYRRSRLRGDDSDSDFDEGEDPAWPKTAWHDEDYFGYAFDAGDNRIYRYAFKEDPDMSILPEYGDARVNEYESRW